MYLKYETPPQRSREALPQPNLYSYMAKPKLGDYVLASKYSDGDVNDPWFIGFVGGKCRFNPDKYTLVDNDGNFLYREGGFRRAKKITPEIGKKLLENADLITSMNTSIWKVLKHIDKL